MAHLNANIWIHQRKITNITLLILLSTVNLTKGLKRLIMTHMSGMAEDGIVDGRYRR